MKRIAIMITALFAVFSAMAQTMNVADGSVTWAFTAEQVGKMTYSEGTSLTIQGKTFAVGDIDQISFSDEAVDDNTVNIAYNGTSASVVVAGNVAQYLTVSVSNAKVSILQDSGLTDEITYTLSGSSSDGQFYMDGELKATVVLNGLTLTNTDGAPIQIDNGKRIEIQLADGTTNTLVDSSDGEQKGCLACKGHIEFKGGGTLNITGNTKHGIWAKEYIEVKASVGTIKISSAVGDGIHCQQYFQQNGGTITISGVGDDGLQCEIKDADSGDEEDTGEVIIQGGTLNITTTAAASKGIKAEGNITVNESKSTPAITVTTSGGCEYDEDDSEYKACCGIASDANIAIEAGTFTLKSTGAGGKCMKADGTLNVAGGTINATTTGAAFYSSSNAASSDGRGGGGPGGGDGPGGGGGGPGGGGGGMGGSDPECSPKAIKILGNITISDGTITVSTSGANGEGIESKANIYIKGGTIKVEAYDDAINSANDMYISGGTVNVRGTNNDGLDSNGNMYISGGTIVAFGSSAPECGIDVNEEENKILVITGGNVFGIGGSASSHPSTSASTQPYITTSGVSFSQNATVTLKSGSTTLATFTMPWSYSSGQVICSAPGMSKGSSYTLSYGSSSKTATAVQYSSNR